MHVLLAPRGSTCMWRLRCHVSTEFWWTRGAWGFGEAQSEYELTVLRTPPAPTGAGGTCACAEKRGGLCVRSPRSSRGTNACTRANRETRAV